MPTLTKLSINYVKIIIAVFVVISCTNERSSAKSETKTENLSKRFTVLSSGKTWTIVPRKSVIHVPKHMQKKISEKQPNSKFLSFKQFSRKHSGWLHTFPVSEDQSFGRKEIAESRWKTLTGLSKIVITTYNKNPVSLHDKARPSVSK